MSTYVVAITGASGAMYAKGVLRELLALGHCVELAVSPNGERILELELGFASKGSVEERRRAWVTFLGHGESALHLSDHSDVTAGICSGSFLTSGMIIVPCSMGTLGRIASGVSSNVIERAADVTLKERRPLILVPRETPLNLIHLRNMVSVTEAGGEIMPPMPQFCHYPLTIDDLVSAFVGRLLDRLGIPNHLAPRWTESRSQQARGSGSFGD